MWQTKYALAVPKNLGFGLNFWPLSEGYFLSGRSVVRGAQDQDLAPFFGDLSQRHKISKIKPPLCK